MIRTIVTMLLLVSITVQARAQQLHKCVDAKGQASYQSAPCNADQREVWTRDATPEPSTGPGRTTRMRPQQEKDPAHSTRMSGTHRARRRAGSGIGVSLPAYSSKNPNACQAAKDQREARLKAAGTSRSFSLLRRLDEMVWDACK